MRHFRSRSRENRRAARERAAQVAAIPSTLAQLSVPIETLSAYPRNPRRGRVDVIKRSLLRHGQYRPIVVNKPTREVLAGNHTLVAARELGWHEIAATFVDVDADTAARIVAIDNRANDLASNDDAELAQLLQSLPDLDGTGYDDDDLTDLLAQLDVAPDFDEPLDESKPDRFTFDVYSRDELIETAFRYHREHGFPYRSLARHESMFEINKLAALSEQTLMRTTLGYAVADTYHPHRYAAHVGTQRNALDTFDDDRLLHVALGHIVEYGLPWTSHSVANLCSLTHGAQAASNFRPGAALALLHRYAPPGAVLLDTSTGYGGRLVGFLASDCTQYVGVDPASETHAGNERLAAELCPATKSVELHQLPAEDVPHELLRDRCDVALTSPPYFAKERYVDEPTQSFARYPSAVDWRDGFLRPMLELQHAALRRDAISVLNVADVKLAGEFVPLVEWSLALAREVGFEIVAVDELPLTRRWGPQLEEVATEPLIVMRKPG
jgi:hypothetical protein